ncbi:hypothetical protein [Flectobacillus roseus]|uniref:hypothetical protein n=1 Tax=Flectobacillus roseus TaxID=502259 RepID=UPI0024B75733|nr:hypothetical protein [Flectobacillus roseus]MDI9871569.1 hypothetical protein [Flectobacillus roseus]
MLDSKKQLRQIFNNYSNPLQILSEIKNQISPSEYENIINSYPTLKKFKGNNLKFKDIKSINQKDALVFTKDFKREINWLLFDIKQEASFINSFLFRKKEFEKLFMMCSYELAETKLDEIKVNYGESLWTLEMSLLLKEYRFGAKDNWIELSSYLSQINSPFYQFIINFYSKRVEEKMSFENCFTLFQNDFNGVNADEQVRDFFVFKCLYSANFEYSYRNLESVLYISNIFGIIDQYLVTVEVLIKLVSNQRNNDKVIIQFLKKIHNEITNDHRLANIINLVDEKIEAIILPNTDTILPIIDDYTNGNFKLCIEQCLNCLKVQPDIFELYEIYVKSLINLGLDFHPTGISTFVDRIIESIFRAMLHKEDSEKFKKKIMKYAITLLSFDFGKQLFVFGLELTGDRQLNNHKLIRCLSSTINNPKILSLDLIGRERNISEKYKIFQSSISFAVNNYINGTKLEDNLKISNQNQSIIYQARHEFKLSNFEKTIELVEPIVNDSGLSPFYFDNVISLLIDSYIAVNRIIPAMILSANIVTDKVFYTNNLNISNITSKIKNDGISKYASYIDMPILFSLVCKEYDLYEVYVDFMLYYNEEYPSRLDIVSLRNKFSIEKIIYFLREVCTVSTLRYSIEFSSINEVEQERCNICSLLKQLDSVNASFYDNEIAELLRSDAVRKAIKEVDEGRLYVDIESLKNLQVNNIKESFARFKEIEFTTKDKGLIGFNASKERDWDQSTSFQQNDAQNELNNPAFLAFKSIYLETRDKFLYSKEYGLESCISSKIRHGALRNLLRSVFDKLNLVTSKTGENYIDNLYWYNQFGFDYEINSKVQSRLKLFSKDIDDTTNFIVEKLIQIRTEKKSENPYGLFDYSTNDEALLDFYESFKNTFDNYSSMVSRIYMELAASTSLHIVPFIQNELSNNVKNKFQNLIEQLQIDIRTINISYPNDLLANISKSSTDIQIVIDSILEWFKFNTSYSSSLLEIETILNASKELTNKFNPNCCISPEIEVNYPDDLTIISSTSMIFVFHILMDNIIKHSKLSSNEIKVKIVLQKVDDFIEIKVINNISLLADVELIKSNLEQVYLNWNNHDNIERSTTEEGSGFHKIKRILLYEALCKTDKFHYSVDNEEVGISLFLPLNNYKNA